MPVPEDKGKKIDALLINMPISGYQGKSVQFNIPIPGYQGKSIQIGDILKNILEDKDKLAEGAVPIAENAELPTMGEGTSIQVQLINGSILLMDANPTSGQVPRNRFSQQKDQSTIWSQGAPVEDLPTVHSTQQERPDQVEKNTMEQKPTRSESYIRLRVRVENGQMSIVGLREVEGPLIQPEKLHAEFVYEVTVGKKRIGIDSFPNPMVRRGYPNPRVPEQRGHSFGLSPRYEFNVRIPRDELSLSDVSKVQIVLYQVSGNVLNRLIGSELLADQFSYEIKEVARLNEIQVEKLPEAVYVDFTLRIGPDGTIWSSSNEGQCTASIAIAVPEDIQLTLSLIDANKTNEKLLEELGARLYQMIFPPEIDKHFNKTAAAARSQGRRVRIRLSIEPDTLAVLPWEFLFRKEGGYFLDVNPDTVLARYLDLPLPPDLLGKREGPLHLLTIIANPTDQIPLDPDEWERMSTQALRVPLMQGLLTVQTVKHATFEQIRDALLEHKPDMIQFVGHGIYHNGKGYLALVDSKTSETLEVDESRFANIFLDMGVGDTLRLLTLATCESAKSDSPRGFLGIAPQIVQRGVPIVVAMQYSCPISTAEIYLENFYTLVAAHRPVDWAVQHARNAISIKKGLDNRDFATPVLYMRATDGNLFWAQI